MNSDKLLQQLEWELARLNAAHADVQMDDQFEPKAGTLVKLHLGDAYWHFLPGSLLEVLQRLPDAAGPEAIKHAVEKHVTDVWHGPSPRGSRDPS